MYNKADTQLLQYLLVFRFNINSDLFKCKHLPALSISFSSLSKLCILHLQFCNIIKWKIKYLDTKDLYDTRYLI